MILAATGHRPHFCPCKFNEDHKWLKHIKIKLYTWLHHNKDDIEYAISGMAIGWDTWFAEECLKQKIPLHAYIPFEGQENHWPQNTQIRYKNILSATDNIKVICNGYTKNAFLMRDDAMLDAASEIAALWNPHIIKGGTYYTINRAKERELKIINFWTNTPDIYKWGPEHEKK